MAMKRKILLFGLIVCMAGAADAQKKQQKSTAQKARTVQAKPATKENKKVAVTTYRLNSTSTWNARGAAPAGNTRWNISDPTLRILNERANGSETGFRAHEVMGLSKRMFGVAN